MATENPLTGRIGPQIMPSGLNMDTGQALASLDALRGIDADLLPGHGDPWTQGVAEAVQRPGRPDPRDACWISGEPCTEAGVSAERPRATCPSRRRSLRRKIFRLRERQ